MARPPTRPQRLLSGLPCRAADQADVELQQCRGYHLGRRWCWLGDPVDRGQEGQQRRGGAAGVRRL